MISKQNAYYDDTDWIEQKTRACPGDQEKEMIKRYCPVLIKKSENWGVKPERSMLVHLVGKVEKEDGAADDYHAIAEDNGRRIALPGLGLGLVLGLFFHVPSFPVKWYIFQWVFAFF